MTSKSPSLKKLLHVGVVVRDMDKAVKRLEALGLGPFESSHPPLAEKPLIRGKPADADAKVIGLAGSMGEIKLELGQPVEGESLHQEFLDMKGEGIQHIAFEVEDLDKEVAKFTQQGAKVLLSSKYESGERGCYLDLGVGNLIIELEQK